MRVFVTGASGFIGSAVVPELIGAGHQVLGLARSQESADALTAAGAQVQRGTLDDVDALRSAAAASDGVLHLAFKHDIAFSGGFREAADADRRAIDAFGDALAGSDRPLVIASGVAGLPAGRVNTESDVPEPDQSMGGRFANEQAALGLATRGVRSASVRLAPTVHGEDDHGFMAMLIGIARDKGASGYLGDGSNRWPAVHRLDAAQLFRLALEQAPAGSVLHGVAEQGVAFRGIADVIGRHLNLPVVAVSAADAATHFGWLAGVVGSDIAASSTRTRQLLSWEPTHPGLLADLDQGHYFLAPPA